MYIYKCVGYREQDKELLYMRFHRIVIFTGHFGSGKTELAINYALKCASIGEKTVIVDLDIVNPFFRTAEKKEMLEDAGIKVLAPNFAGTIVDIPSLPAEIVSVFEDRSARIIFDVGGDEVGAIALGRYYNYFIREEYSMFYVINAKRPLSSTKQDVIEMLRAVEAYSRLHVKELINNTNLARETTVYDIIEGQSLVDQVSKELNIPIACVSGIPHILQQLPANWSYETFPLKIYMKPSWE